MVLLLTIIICVAVCGGFTKSFPVRFTMPQEPSQRVFENDLAAPSVNEIYDTYYSVADDKEEEELNMVSRIHQVVQNKIHYNSQLYDINGKIYLLWKTRRHRNKRYISSLTLCPFKICNMGRKRTRSRRYIQMIRARGDNEESQKRRK